MRAHQWYSHSTRSSGAAGTADAGSSHHCIVMCLSIGSSRHTSATVSRWSTPVCATSITSASGAESSAASTPPGRGGSTLCIASALRANRCSPSACSRTIARFHRRGVKLAPSGKMTNASLPSSRAARVPMRSSVSVRSSRPMKVLGSRFSSTSIAGSHCRDSLSTMRGSRSYQLMSAWASRNESPGPACRHSTSSGRSRGAESGSVPSMRTVSRSTHRACRYRKRSTAPHSR